MRRIALLILLISVCSARAAKNWNGWLDTAVITGFKDDSLKYSKAFDLGRYENLSVQVKANDTSVAGFGSDSISLRYGYQVGFPCLNSSGSPDTGWAPIVWVDSMMLASIGSYQTTDYQDSALVTHKTPGWVDTLTVTGWAWQASTIAPDYAPLIRYVVQGLTGNKRAKVIRLEIQNHRRMAVATIPTI